MTVVMRRSIGGEEKRQRGSDERAGMGMVPVGEQGPRGKVFLVGAGPGDPDLITVKALRCLRMADVVLYDRLVNSALLDEIHPRAERICVGKRPRDHSMRQEEINTLLVLHARLGRLVVRLKGGDPFVFGRGGEEALALVSAGIPFEVVPGVSAAVAVPAYAGIPVTHRDCASSVTIITGHESSKAGPPAGGGSAAATSGIEWEKYAALDGTLVILMGVEGLATITRRLLGGGLGPDTPAAVIEQGTVAEQRVVIGTLEHIAEQAREARMTSPAVTVIGAVAALGDKLAWFQTLQSAQAL